MGFAEMGLVAPPITTLNGRARSVDRAERDLVRARDAPASHVGP